MFERAAKFFGQAPEVDDDAEIVQKSRQVGPAWINTGNLASKMTAHEGTSQRVLPENHRIHAAGLFGREIEHATRHHDVTEALKAQAKHRGVQRLNFLPPAEQGTVRHLQTLRS